MAETRSSGVRIEFDQSGNGEPALLCMPGWCDNRTVFDALVNKLGGTVLSLDWRGHGGSEKPSADFGLEEQVIDALAVIEASKAERIVTVTMAHAGWVALELRRRLSERIAGLVLIEWIVLEPPPPFLGALGKMQVKSTYAESRDALFAMWTQEANQAARDHVYREMAGYGFEMWSRASRHIAAAYGREGSPLTALSRLSPQPAVLHLYAQPDDPGYLSVQRQFAAANPWFQVQKLDARSHFPMYEVPDAMAEAITRFALATVPTGAGQAG